MAHQPRQLGGKGPLARRIAIKAVQRPRPFAQVVQLVLDLDTVHGGDVARDFRNGRDLPVGVCGDVVVDELAEIGQDRRQRSVSGAGDLGGHAVGKLIQGCQRGGAFGQARRVAEQISESPRRGGHGPQAARLGSKIGRTVHHGGQGLHIQAFQLGGGVFQDRRAAGTGGFKGGRLRDGGILDDPRSVAEREQHLELQAIVITPAQRLCTEHKGRGSAAV